MSLTDKRNPTDGDMEVVEALRRLETLIENQNSHVVKNQDDIKTILRVLGGDIETNGMGVVHRLKNAEDAIRSLDKRISEIVHTALEQERKNIAETISAEFAKYEKREENHQIKTATMKKFVNLPVWQRLTLTIAALSGLGCTFSKVMLLLGDLFTWLAKYLGG